MPRLPGLSDVIAVLQAQTEALAALPGTLVALNRSMRSLAGTIEQSGETFAAVQRVAVRAEGLLEDLEQPLRELAPALQRLSVLLSDPAIEAVPDTLRKLSDEALPVIQGLAETQVKVASIAASTERIMTFADDATARFQALPGASLLRRTPRRDGPGMVPPEEP